MIKSKILATLAAIGLTTASLVGIAAPAAATPSTDGGATKINICHAKLADTAANGWVSIEVDDDSIVQSAHSTEHGADIIPPIPDILPNGYNWGVTGIAGFEGYTGEEIWNNGCAVPDPIDVCSNIRGDQAEVPIGYYEDDGECFQIEPDLATASLTFTPATCFAAELVSTGPISNATWGTDSDATPLGYTIVATANSGAEFADGDSGGLTKTFTNTLDPQLTGKGCDTPVLGLVLPTVSFQQITCRANGSYTLGVAEGYDPTHVTFTVNGVEGKLAGTYPVGTAQKITVVAVAVPPNGLEEWTDPDPFDFIVPTGCELKTLALTGSSAPLWALNAGIGVLVLGAGMLLMRRREESLFE